MTDYAEQMAWCKKRALEYVDRGDLINALASFASDITKDESTNTEANVTLAGTMGLLYVMNDDTVGFRRFIEGFASA